MEQDQSGKNIGILGDQSRELCLKSWKRKFEEDDAPYELRENPKKSWRLTIVHRASNVQERSFKCEKELESHSEIASKSFQCQFCRSKFNSVRGLNGHMRVHSARSPITVTPLPTPPSTSERETFIKKKRSKRLKRSESHYRSQFSEEEIELAEILLTLSASVIPKGISMEEPYPASDQTLSASSSGSDFKFQCKICDRRFASYQQLGGHQTSHRMGKSLSIRTDSSTLEVEDEQRSVDFDSDGCFGGGKVFKCEKCSRVFGSGQALGGHKRAHWDVKKEGIQMHIFDGIAPTWLTGNNNASLWPPSARQIDAANSFLAL